MSGSDWKLPTEVRHLIVDGYEIHSSGWIREPRSLSLLEYAYTHMYALRRVGSVDDNLRVCANAVRCPAKYFFPWTSNQRFCGRGACRSDVYHQRGPRKPRKEGSS